jgi:aerobic carbon-monoxide dehydrogenase small subunit
LRGLGQAGQTSAPPMMILTAKALLGEVPGPDQDRVRRAISGNTRRCTGYAEILGTVRNTAEKRRS